MFILVYILTWFGCAYDLSSVCLKVIRNCESKMFSTTMRSTCSSLSYLEHLSCTQLVSIILQQTSKFLPHSQNKLTLINLMPQRISSVSVVSFSHIDVEVRKEESQIYSVPKKKFFVGLLIHVYSFELQIISTMGSQNPRS